MKHGPRERMKVGAFSVMSGGLHIQCVGESFRWWPEIMGLVATYSSGVWARLIVSSGF